MMHDRDSTSGHNPLGQSPYVKSLYFTGRNEPLGKKARLTPLLENQPRSKPPPRKQMRPLLRCCIITAFSKYIERKLVITLTVDQLSDELRQSLEIHPHRRSQGVHPQGGEFFFWAKFTGQVVSAPPGSECTPEAEQESNVLRNRGDVEGKEVI